MLYLQDICCVQRIRNENLMMCEKDIILKTGYVFFELNLGHDIVRLSQGESCVSIKIYLIFTKIFWENMNLYFVKVLLYNKNMFRYSMMK